MEHIYKVEGKILSISDNCLTIESLESILNFAKLNKLTELKILTQQFIKEPK